MDIKEKLEKYYGEPEPGEAAEILANCPTYAHACKALSADAAAEILEKCKLSEIIKNEGLSPEILTNGKVSAETVEEYKTLTEFYRRLERINKRLVEDAKDLSFPDKPAEMLAEYEVFADTLGDDRKRRFYIQVLIRTAKDNLGKGDRDGFKINMLRLEMFSKALLNDKNAAKALKLRKDGATGGKLAAEFRTEPRKKVKERIKEEIKKRKPWDNLSQNIKSITNTIWPEIKKAIENGSDWHGIASTDLQQAKIGKNSVYIAVQETDPR